MIYACNTAGIWIGGYDAQRSATLHFDQQHALRERSCGNGCGQVQMQFNIWSDDAFENNIVYAGTKCLMTVSKAGPAVTSTPTVALDHNVYYCASGAGASKWGWFPANYCGIRELPEGYGKRPELPLRRSAVRQCLGERLSPSIDVSGDRCGPQCGRLDGTVRKDLDGRPRVHGANVSASY